MKLNLLNLLKANVLKAGMLKSIAPTASAVVGSDFKDVLAETEASPPPTSSTKLQKAEPPVEKSAVSISKRYSKSHAETQDNVKQEVRSQSSTESAVVEKVTSPMTVAPVPQAIAVIASTLPVVGQSKVTTTAKPFENAISVVPPLPKASKTTDVHEAAPKNTHSTHAEHGTRNVVAATARKDGRLGDLPNAKPPDRETAAIKNEVKAVVTAKIEPEAVSIAKDANVSSTTKQSASIGEARLVVHTVAPKQCSQGVKISVPQSNEPRPLTRQSEALAPRQDNQDVKAKVSLPNEPQPLARQSESTVTKSEARQSVSTGNNAPKGSNPTVNTVSREARVVNEFIQQPATQNVKEGSPVVVERQEPTQRSQTRREPIAPQQNRKADQTVDAPIKQTASSIKLNAEAVQTKFVPILVGTEKTQVAESKTQVASTKLPQPVESETVRPRVVQQVWAAEATQPERKVAVAERATPKSMQAEQSKPITKVDTAFVRPTLEAAVLQKPTMADVKLEAAVMPRVDLKNNLSEKVFSTSQTHVDVVQTPKPVEKKPIVLMTSAAKVEQPKVTQPSNMIQSRAPKTETENRSDSATTKAETVVEVPKNQAHQSQSAQAQQPISTPTLQKENVVEKAASAKPEAVSKEVKQEPASEGMPPELRSPSNTVPTATNVEKATKSEQNRSHIQQATHAEAESSKHVLNSSPAIESKQELPKTDPRPIIVDQNLAQPLKPEQKLEAKPFHIQSDITKSSEELVKSSQTPLSTKTETAESAVKDAAPAFRPLKVNGVLEPLTQTTPQVIPAQAIQEIGKVIPRIDTTKGSEFMRGERVGGEREEPVSRSNSERPQQVVDSKPNEQSNHNGQETQSQNRERESSQMGFRQSIEQATQSTSQTPVPRTSTTPQSSMNESLKLALQQALDQSRKRMADPDELRMSIPIGELGIMDIDIVREADQFSIRIAADPQAIAMMEEQRGQLTQWLRSQGYPVEQIDVAPRFNGQAKSDLPGSNQSTEDQDSNRAGQPGRGNRGGSGAGETHDEASARPAYSGLRVWTA